MMVGWAGGNRENKIRRPFSRKKIISEGLLGDFERPSLGKNNFQKAIQQRKYTPFSIFSPAPPPDH